MKKIFTLAISLGMAFLGYSQTYISEDFSTFSGHSPTIASGWKNVDSLNSPAIVDSLWRFDNPGGQTLNAPIAGVAAILDSDYYGFGNTQDAHLVSPNFDASLATTVTLEFDHYFQSIGTSSGEVQVYDGTTWNVVATFTGASTANPAHEIIDISTHVVGITNAQVRFRYQGSYGWYWIVDNITVFQPVPDDLKALRVDTLVNGCGLSSTNPVSLTFTNVGSTVITGVPVRFQVNGGTAVAETYPGTLNPGDTATHVFTGTANLSTPGAYVIEAYTALRSDANNVNDTASGTSIHKVTNNTFPYYEDFESGNGGWTASGAASSWAFGTPAKTIINSASSGVNAWTTGLTTGYNANEESWVIAPCFDFTTLAAPQIKMNVWWESESSYDGAVLQSSIDNGISWQNVGAFGDPNNWYSRTGLFGFGAINPTGDAWAGNGTLGSAGWLLAEHDLTGLGGQSSVQLRVLFGSDGSVQYEGFAFDNVLIQDAPADDIGMVAITRPAGGCGLTGSDTLEVCLWNAGSSSASNFNLSYVVNGGTPVNETYTGIILPGDTVKYKFTTLVNLSSPIQYNFEAYSSLTGDANLLNDTITDSVTNRPVVTIPFNEDFETGAANIAFDFVTNSESKAYVHPSSANSSLFGLTLEGNSATSYTTPNATNVWTTNPLHFSSASICVDLTGVSAAEIKLDLQQGFNFNDFYTNFRITVNGNQVGPDHRPSGATTPWITIVENISSYAGSIVNVSLESMVKYDTTSPNFNFIDNLSIRVPAANDAKALYFNTPNDGCGLTTDSVTMCFANIGSAVMTNFPLSYVLNNGTPVTETYTGTVNPGDTVCHTFLTPVNLATPGTYTLDGYIDLAGDADVTNDSISTTINSIPVVNTFPYVQGFETGNGGWAAGGTNSSWAIGTPLGATISIAASGTEAAVTNLSGDYNNSENSYIESPCLDFSSLVADPILSFSHTYITEACCDEGWVEYSIDAGVTWTKLVDNGGALEWYNDLGNQWWDGTSSAGSGVWVSAENVLTGLAGQTDVKIRFGFSSDGSVTEEGFGVDNIRIGLPPADDIAMIEFTKPAGGCGLTGSDTLAVKLRNAGSASASNFNLSYTVNGGTAVTETYTGVILPGDTVEYKFTTLVNLSATTTYNFEAYSSLTGDANSLNDTIIDSVTNRPVATFPFTDDFETGMANSAFNFITNTNSQAYVHSSSANNSLFGLTLAGSTNLAYTTPNATNVWTTNPLHFASAEFCLDLTGISNPELKLHLQQGRNFNDFYTNFRVTVDGVQVGPDYRPAGATTAWDTITQDLSAHAGSIVNVALESMVKYDTISPNFNFIDNISIDLPVGIEVKTSGNTNYTLYPNPSNGYFTLDIENKVSSVNVEIIDINGKLVSSETIGNTSNSIRFDLNHLPKGVYFLKATNSEFNLTEKLIIK